MFDARKQIDNIVEWIRDYYEAHKMSDNAKAIIGISGGKDSTIVAMLLVKALGKDRVIGVLMPNGVQADIADSKKVVEVLGIDNFVINIGGMFEAGIQSAREAGVKISADDKINLPPRCRMAMLYVVAQSEDCPFGGLVVNTCNKSEDYVGYSTKFGDSAGDFSPCSDFTVTEMLQIGDELLKEFPDIPYTLIHKTPSDGLCGKTDEDNLGFTYAELDRYINTGEIDDPAKKENIDRRHRRNLHKLLPLPIYQSNIKRVKNIYDI